MSGYVLALDQGTTSTRAIVFDKEQVIRGSAQEEFPQHYPASGWVEHDPEDLWRTALATMQAALAKAGLAARDIAGVGITNQRETAVVWDRRSGRAVYNAIVWQDRRTADLCARLREEGTEPLVRQRTGLLLDPYFSGTKIAWILDNVSGARQAAEAGHLAFGTVDAFLLWRLTGGRVHATDATNASRTLLFDIHRGEWDHELLQLFRVPPVAASGRARQRSRVRQHGPRSPWAEPFAIGGIAGDQQAATVGQACFEPGMVKSTYGTGCFAVLNTGEQAVQVGQQAPDHDRLQAGRAHHLCAGRLDLHRRLRGAMAARLASRSSTARIAPARWPRRPTLSRTVILVPAFTGSGRRTGT
jgi:glycerol kinase